VSSVDVPRSLERIAAIVRQQRFGRFVGAVSFVAFAVLFELPESRDFDQWMNMVGPDGAAVWILRVPALGFLLAGTWLLVTALRSRPEDAPILRLLLDAPDSIVWVHANFAIERHAYGATIARSRIVFLMTTSGAGLSIEVPAREMDGVLDGLESYLPHATFGFTAERKKRYAENPELLRIRAEGSAYRGKSPADTARLRPPAAGPIGAGAIVVLAALLLRVALLGQGCSSGGSGRSLGPTRLTPPAVALPAGTAPAIERASVALPGDLAITDTRAYYSVPLENDLFGFSKEGHDTASVVRHDASLGAITASGSALYYVLGQTLWTLPKPFDERFKVGEGLVDAYRVVIAGKHAYALDTGGIDQMDLHTGEVRRVVSTRYKVLASDGARALFYDETLKALDDQTGRITSLLSQPRWINAIAACGTSVYFTTSSDGTLYSLAAPSTALAHVDNGRAIACDGSAVYWVDANVIKRRTRAGAGVIEVVTGGVPENAQIAVDETSVWFTVAGSIRQVDKSATTR